MKYTHGQVNEFFEKCSAYNNGTEQRLELEFVEKK